MKHLMMTLAVVAIGLVVNASTVDWQFTANSTYNGYTVYTLLTVPTSPADAATLTSASVGSAVIKRVATAYKITGSSTVTADGTTSLYFVLISADSSQYWVSAAKTGTAYTPPATQPDALTYNASSDLSSGWTSFSTVPEPASVGLLLLGLCALGLKRKVA